MTTEKYVNDGLDACLETLELLKKKVDNPQVLLALADAKSAINKAKMLYQ